MKQQPLLSLRWGMISYRITDHAGLPTCALALVFWPRCWHLADAVAVATLAVGVAVIARSFLVRTIGFL